MSDDNTSASVTGEILNVGRGDTVLVTRVMWDSLTDEVVKLRRERDAATTAERDRIRVLVPAMAKPHKEGCPQKRSLCRECPCGAAHYNAALADVARIIDAGP